MKNTNGQFSGSEGRRSSFSDRSEEGSPTRTRAQNQAKLAVVQEVSSRTLLLLLCLHFCFALPLAHFRKLYVELTLGETEALDSGREKGRVREEEGEFLDSNTMDAGHDRCLLRRIVHGPHLHDCHCYCSPDHLLQGSHCHCQRSQPSQISALHQEYELVLLCHHHVLSLWRERHLLL